MERDNKEISDIIYDTLMQNKQWPHLLTEEVEQAWIDSGSGKITFEYSGKVVTILVSSKPLS